MKSDVRLIDQSVIPINEVAIRSYTANLKAGQLGPDYNR